MFGLIRRRKKEAKVPAKRNVLSKGPSLGHRAATRFSDFMSKREAGTSFRTRKVVLFGFCAVMLLLLWLPFFLRQKPHVVHTGHIIAPLDLSREDFRLQNKLLDSAIAAQNRLRLLSNTGATQTDSLK